MANLQAYIDSIGRVRWHEVENMTDSRCSFVYSPMDEKLPGLRCCATKVIFTEHCDQHGGWAERDAVDPEPSLEDVHGGWTHVMCSFTSTHGHKCYNARRAGTDRCTSHQEPHNTMDANEGGKCHFIHYDTHIQCEYWSKPGIDYCTKHRAVACYNEPKSSVALVTRRKRALTL